MSNLRNPQPMVTLVVARNEGLRIAADRHVDGALAHLSMSAAQRCFHDHNAELLFCAPHLLRR
jgi:hypothetical protein